MRKSSKSNIINIDGMAVPEHMAIIMDGNGRWANGRGLPRSAGHKAGVEATRRVVRAAGEIGVGYLTLFAFSSENWKRPETEVRELMRLLRIYLRAETADLHKDNVRLRVIGDRTMLAKDTCALIEQAETLTVENEGLQLTIALNYGGRDELAYAAHGLIKDYKDKDYCPDIEEVESRFESFLMTKGLPDPDLVIRTSGEHRISNFLLWQCAYSEFVFMDVLWPDFNRDYLIEAVQEYSGRERRFGRAVCKKTDKEASGRNLKL
jgi:undecaprenyl diphosphate synthase